MTLSLSLSSRDNNKMKLDIASPTIYRTKLYRRVKAKGKLAWANYLRKKLDKAYEQRQG